MSVNPFTVGTRRVGIYRQSFSMDTLQNRTKGYFNTHLEISLDYFYLTINISIWIFNIFNCTIIHDNFNCSIIIKITCSRFSIYCKIFSSNYISSTRRATTSVIRTCSSTRRIRRTIARPIIST